MLLSSAPSAGEPCALDAALSGLTFGALRPPSADALPPAKRPRPASDPAPCDLQTYCGSNDLAALPRLELLHRHDALDVDRLVLHHMESMRVELAERQRAFLRLAVAAIGGEAARRLRAKEQEIEQARRLAAALEERGRALAVEARIWRELAESHEAAALSLRRDLEDALGSHRPPPAAPGDDDAESCCDSGGGATAAAPLCRGCGAAEPSVLVLPCRHLCLCSACASATQSCLVCGCAKQCTVHVNLS